MNLEPVILSEVSQKEKNKYCILMHIYLEFRKMYDLQGRNRDIDIKNRLWTQQRRRRSNELRE